MMNIDRYNLIGIKQIIRLEWLRMTVNLLLAGLDVRAVRAGLHEYLANDSLYSRPEKNRSSKSRAFAVNNLMKIWATPAPELVAFRDEALEYIRLNPNMDFAVHWAMLCAAYPFWFNIARQTGRLLALQSLITSAQVVSRIREQYGDRTTVARNTGYVLGAFHAWDVLKGNAARGCYSNVPGREIKDPKLAVLLLEAALLALPEGKSSLQLLVHCPAFFPLQLPIISAAFIERQALRLELLYYGYNEEIVKLR